MTAAANAQADQQAAQADQRAAQADQRGAHADQGSKAADLDTIFLKATAVDNTYEIQLSQLAESKAQDDKVKQLAQMLVRDHTQAKQQLDQVAQKKQVQLPTDLPELKKEEMQIFQGLQGSEFDPAYLSCMKVGHAKSVAAYSEKAKKAKDQDVKQFAAAILPKLQEHKQHVKAMTGGIGDEAETAGSRQEPQTGSHGETAAPGADAGKSGAPGQPGAGEAQPAAARQEPQSGQQRDDQRK